MRRPLQLLVLGTAAALVAGTALAGGAARVRVSLTASATTPETGDAVVLTARTAPKLPRGARLLVQQRAEGEKAWSPARECASSPCKTSLSEPDAGTVTFRARAIRRKHGSKGRIVDILGTSPVVPVTWQSPPPPPPPPSAPKALAGTYCGFNDQGKSVCIDVTPDQSSVTNFATESIVTCSDGSRWQWHLSFRSLVPIQADLGFTYSYSGPLISSNSSFTNINAIYSINGTFDTAGNVTGKLALTSISWDLNGTHYSCSSAPYGWSAKRGA